MDTFRIMCAVYLLVAGAGNQVIDDKHRKRNAYEPGCAWQHYAKLAREGSREGKFMMWSGHIGIWFIIATIATGCYQLATH